jgi:nitrate/TMAO reductase-like tetraheme cytochrome c subunit
MNTGVSGPDGRAARAPCGTCHGFVEPKDKYATANRLGAFHKGVEIAHGGQSCRTCHTVPGLDAFNLAGGEKVSYDEVMRLCGQCHAQRLQEYERGAHGGMTGYWDLGRGPRSRNHCLDCHNPHAPAIPRMTPAPAPVYRTFE